MSSTQLQPTATTSTRPPTSRRGRPAPILLTTAGRVVRQLRHDPRTIAMLLVVPLVLMTLIYFLFDGRRAEVDPVLLILLGIFPFMIMFLITSIAMLRERTSGTLERLMTTPTRQVDLLGGYGLAFGAAAAVQGAVASAFAYWVLGLDIAGGAGLVLLITVLTALLGVGLGLLASAFARTEFQAVQLLPVVVVPQILLCGLFAPRDAMPDWLHVISDVLPLSYAVDALQQVGAHTDPTGQMWRDLGIVAGCVLLALGLAAATLRRRTP